jgi:hypothetical protein
MIRADTASLETIIEDVYVDTDESGSQFDQPAILAALNLKAGLDDAVGDRSV